MEAQMEIRDPEMFLKKLQQISKEREKEFQMREEAYLEKHAQLQKLLESITQQKGEQEKQREGLERKERDIREMQERMEGWEAGLRKAEAELRQRQEETDKKEQELYMKYNLEIENARNEDMKLKRLVSEYDYKISLLDNGLMQDLQEIQKGPAADPSGYIPVPDHEAAVEALQARIRELEADRTALEKQVEGLEAERIGLLKNIMEKGVKTDSRPVQPVRDPEATDGLPEEADARIQNQETDTSAEKPEERQEELTAEVLKNYLIKNERRFTDVRIHHSDEGEQLHARQGGLQYRFLFSRPATFDIFAFRKNSSRLRKTLEACNMKHPGVQFRYDSQEGAAYASGFFTNDIAPYNLMSKVDEISDCFNQE